MIYGDMWLLDQHSRKMEKVRAAFNRNKHLFVRSNFLQELGIFYYFKVIIFTLHNPNNYYVVAH